MSDNFECPECGHNHIIYDIELWEVYEEDGKETEFTCIDCECEFIIRSEILSWSFNTEASE